MKKPPQSSSSQTTLWSSEDAERHLRSLELFGMRFGLDRMRRMMTALGSPERRFASIHVVGTNGKSSTTRMIAAILERHGLRTATYTSPHLISYTERVQVGERDVDGDVFAAAISRAAWAAEHVNHTLAGDDHVTQFELLTAAALWGMAEQGVQVAVVEAGLGGRYDATSVIDSRVTVLTNVGLEHTRWLGPTVTDIAEEKLAVLRPDTTLVLGEDLAAEALVVAERVAGEQDARIVHAGAESFADIPLAARGSFQRRNFALARTAAETYLRELGIEPREDAVREAAAATKVQGRLQVVGEDPLTVLDGAHNPDATRALALALPEVFGDRPVGLVLGVLEDKDAASMLRTLLGVCERAWFTAPPSSRALSPAALQSLARQLGFDTVVCEPQPWRALTEAQRWARTRGENAAVLATGSVYLVGDLLGYLCSADEGSSADRSPESSEQRTSHGGRR
jgi:dihydrofolate synthase/folylpolyglutamate synthase